LKIKKYQNLLAMPVLLLAFIMLITSSGLAAVQFSDIQGHWAEAAIKKAAAEDIVKGYPDGTFKPDDNISRAEFATIIVQAFKLEKREGKVFGDTGSHWAKDYIATANAHGIVSGYDEQKFGPDGLITREEMALMIVKAAGLKVTAGGIDASDSSQVASWARDAVATAYASKLIVGMPDGSFQPQANAARAQAVLVLNRAMELTAEPIDAPETDTPAAPPETTGEVTGSSGGGGGGGGGSGGVTLRSIEILTEPDKTVYTSGDKLDLTGLSVILNYSDASTEDVYLVDFSSKGITAAPADGTVLNTGHTAVTISKSGQSVSQPITVRTSGQVTVTDVSSEARAAHVNWYRFNVQGNYNNIQIKTADGTALGAVLDKSAFKTAGFYQGLAAPDKVIVIYIDGIERYRGIPAAYDPDQVTVTDVSSEARAAHVNWYRFNVQGNYNNIQIKTADGTVLGALLDKSAFEAAGFYQGLAAPDKVIVIYIDGVERYRGIPADYDPDQVTVTDVSSEARAAHVNWYRFTIQGNYNNIQIKTADGAELGAVLDRAAFETAGFYQGLAAPDKIIVIYIDGEERYRGIPADYSPGEIEITSISIKNAPDKTVYTAGEQLDLTGLMVTISKSDGASEDVAWTDFSLYGITTTPLHGASLTTADESILISAAGQTTLQSIVVETGSSEEVTVTDVSVKKYWDGILWNYNIYRFTVNGPYSNVQIKTAEGTALGLRISKTYFENRGYYMSNYFEGVSSLDSVIVIYVDGIERYRGVPTVL